MSGSANIAGRSFGQRLGRSLPIYAFVAVGMSSKMSDQDREEMGPEWEKGFHNVCNEIKVCIAVNND